MSLKSDFQKDRYVIIRNAISDETLSLINNYVKLQQANNYFSPDKYFAVTKYMDPVMQSLLMLIQKKVEVVVEKDLFPTYSHVRIYNNGDYLPAHTDRESCEYSVTMALDYNCDFVWPIFVMNGDQKVNAFLDRGDMLIYKGIEVIHGRDMFMGDSWTQVFLHYVDQAGEFKEWKYDKNPSLSRVPA